MTVSPETIHQAVASELRLRMLKGEEYSLLDVNQLPSVESVPKASPKPSSEEPSSRDLPPPSEAEHSRPVEPPVASPAAGTPEKWEVVSGVFIEPIPDSPPMVKLEGNSKQEQWERLRTEVCAHPVCNAHVTEGCQVVFGVGNLDADIFFVGEAPGRDEELQGEPFVGRAGQLLTKMIGAMGLSREKVYIGNIMNWRPEMPTKVGNRPPHQKEMEFCLPFLKAQIQIVQPKVLVALGATAVSGLLGPDPKRTLGSVRGKWHEFESIPLMIAYHPSYILRNGSLKSKRTIWEDLLAVMEKAQLPISEKQRGYFLSD